MRCGSEGDDVKPATSPWAFTEDAALAAYQS
jgi:hypothetical protein